MNADRVRGRPADCCPVPRLSRHGAWLPVLPAFPGGPGRLPPRGAGLQASAERESKVSKTLGLKLSQATTKNTKIQQGE